MWKLQNLCGWWYNLYKYSGATQKKLTNQITGKYQYIPKKLVVGQSAARKKTISYLKHNIFKKAKCFTSIQNFTYNTLEMYIKNNWKITAHVTQILLHLYVVIAWF